MKLQPEFPAVFFCDSKAMNNFSATVTKSWLLNTF